MKKVIIIFLISGLALFSIKKVSSIEIPDDAIRIRVVASSNLESDQEIKLKVKENVQNFLIKKLENSKSKEQVKKIIEDNIENLNNIVNNVLISNNVKMNYNINYGLNYFPKKVYKGIEYKEGYYESLVITLGNGKGKNWWCILFPPLCLIDATETENLTEVEYKLYVKKIIEKFKN